MRNLNQLNKEWRLHFVHSELIKLLMRLHREVMKLLVGSHREVIKLLVGL